jgi:hypothetical protein
MRKQVVIGFLLPILVLGLISVAAIQHKNQGNQEIQKLPRLTEAQVRELRVNQRPRRSHVERLKTEDVTVEIHGDFPVYPNLESLVNRCDGMVLGTILKSEPSFRIDEYNDVKVYTDYTVAVEDDFGHPPKGFEAGQKVVIRSAGGKAKIGEHFFETRIRDWPKPEPGDRAIFFLIKEEDESGKLVYFSGPRVFIIKDGMLHMEKVTRDHFGFAIGKSPKEFMAEVRVMAPLLGAASKK